MATAAGVVGRVGDASRARNQPPAFDPLVAAFDQVRDQPLPPAAKFRFVGGPGSQVVHFGRILLDVEQLLLAVPRVVDVLPLPVRQRVPVV